MIDFKDILECCQAEAIANKVAPTDESIWRSMCRAYSRKFNTPLYLVEEMDPKHVLLNIYEEQLEDLDTEDYQKLEHVLDTLRSIEDPTYEAQKSKEQEEFDRKAEEEEQIRIKSGKALHPSLQKKLNEKILLEKGEPLPPEKPTGGSINLEYLAKQDREG